MDDATRDKIVEAGARALLALKGVDYDNMPERYKAEYRAQARACLSAFLAQAEQEGVVLVRWPPNGDDVQACADEVNPYAETAAQYGLTVEMVCDVIEAWKRAATLAAKVTL